VTLLNIEGQMRERQAINRIEGDRRKVRLAAEVRQSAAGLQRVLSAC
jgi:hypothetical protein